MQEPFETYVLMEYDFPFHAVNQALTERVRRVECEWGSFVLKKSRVSQAQLAFVAHALHYLKHKGFIWVAPFVRNKYGEPFVPAQNGNYYVTEWIPHSDVRGDRTEKLWTRMAEMHRLAMGYQYDRDARARFDAQALSREWARQMRVLEHVKDKAEARHYRSPFDTAFLANYEKLSEMGKEALDLLENWQRRQSGGRPVRTTLCHGRMQRNHMLEDRNGELYFIGFDHAGLDTPLRDLVSVLRSQIAASGWERAFDETALERYEEVCPLTEEERQLLAICLLFPQRVIREAAAYAQPQRNRSELTSVKRLERRLHQTELSRMLVRDWIG